MEPGETQPQIRDAVASDKHGLSTIFARSFHPVNQYMKKAIPDTDLVRDWWTRLFDGMIQDDTCHVLTAIDADPNPGAESVIGALCLHLHNPTNMSTPPWTKLELTPDHDAEAFKASADNNSHMPEDRPYYTINVFCVDYGHAGKGIGKRLLSLACAIVDKDGIEVFVEANQNARFIYLKHGFEVKNKVRMPGEIEYWECMLVRPAGGFPS